MKKFKPFSFVRNSIFSLLAAFAMTSCQHMGEPVREFFKEYTETAVILYDDLGSGNLIDNTGVPCIPYTEDGKEILYTLRNPQHYDLKIDVQFPPEAQAIFASGLYELKITKEDRGSLLRIHYPGNFLYALEMGKDMSPTINLTEPKSGRVFTPYTSKIHVNSIPPLVSNQVVMLDSTNPDDLKYVVCFEFPKAEEMNSESIHNDIAEFSLGGRIYSTAFNNFFLDSDGTVSISDDSSVPPYITAKRPEKLVGNSVTGSNASFNVKDGQAFYFVTGTSLTDQNITYSMVMKDRAGLSSVSYASVQAEKIGMVGATADGKPVREDSTSGSTGQIVHIEQAEDGAGRMVLEIPRETVRFNSENGVWEKVNDIDGVVVKYEVYCAQRIKEDGTERWVYPEVPTLKGTCTDSTPITVPPVACKVKAFATKYMYVDSEMSTFYVKPDVSKIYVSSKGKDLSGSGTKENPCSTLEYALSIFDGRQNENNVIYIMDDISGSVAAENITMEFAGYEGMKKIDCGSEGFVVGRNSKITLHNIMLDGSHGNGITLNGTESEGAVLTTADVMISNCRGAGIADVSGGYGIINLGNNTLISKNNSGIESSGDASCGTKIYIDGKVVVFDNGMSEKERRNLVVVGTALPGNPSAMPLHISGPLAQDSKIGITLSGVVPDIGLPVVFTDGFTMHNPEGIPRSFFNYDGDSFGISNYLEDGEAKVVLGGGELIIKKTSVSFTIESHGMTKVDGIYRIPYAGGGTDVKFTPHYQDDLEGLVLSDMEIVLRKLNDSIVIGHELDCVIPDYGPGRFQLVIRGTYGGSAFSDTFEMDLEDSL